MKRKIIYFIVVILFATEVQAQPPNNTIFFGSGGDGINKSANALLSTAIFLGGAGDGFSIASNGAVSNSIFLGSNGDGSNFSTNGNVANPIFLGSIGDGFNYASNGAASNTIFTGGIGDGFNFSGNAAISNNIFLGGNGDGWNYTTNGAASNNIFVGGDGDGWSSVYRPMGPLPVTFTYFTALKLNDKAALLKWQTSQEINSDYFEIQRSNDALNFIKVGNVSAAGNSSLPVNYSFTDYYPLPGINYYRLKQTDKDAHYIYTAARVVKFDNLDKGMVKYYPNPTYGILYIEISEDMKKEAKLINISNVSGMVINQLKVPANGDNILMVNMQAYTKGIYFVQVKTATINNTHRIVLQ